MRDRTRPSGFCVWRDWALVAFFGWACWLCSGCGQPHPTGRDGSEVDPQTTSSSTHTLGDEQSSEVPAQTLNSPPSNSPGPIALAPFEASDRSGEIIRPAVYAEATDEPEVEDSTDPGRQPAEDWPMPRLALFLTGRQSGYIEPCGCTGLANAKGGLSRRHSLLRQLQQRKWAVLPLDVGNQVRRFGVQSEIKLQTTANCLRIMGYTAIGFGPDDLRLSVGELAAVAAGEDEDQSPFVSCNVNLLDINRPYIVQETAGVRVGITAVLGSEELRQVNSEEIELRDPVSSLRELMPQLLSEKCHMHVLLAYASLEESRELARMFPQFGIVVTAGGATEPALEPELIPGTQRCLIQTGAKGMYVGIVGLYPGETPPLRYERVPLDARLPDSPAMLEQFELYQQQLKTQGLDGLGLRPVKHPSNQGSFVGHQVCGECHTKAYEIFEGTPHFHATDSIANPTERSNIPRHHDPECLSCHVTGWDPQGYFPYESGYLDLQQSVALHSNGCENCHGPGSRHVAIEREEVQVSDQERELFRAKMRLTLQQAENKCVECHDLDNSPDFDFEEYWAQIEHYGKD